jgi:hypothetical protein
MNTLRECTGYRKYSTFQILCTDKKLIINKNELDLIKLVWTSGMIGTKKCSKPANYWCSTTRQIKQKIVFNNSTAKCIAFDRETGELLQKNCDMKYKYICEVCIFLCGFSI